MTYRHYVTQECSYGIDLWRTSSSKKWTLDIFWGKHVFAFLLYRIK